MTKTAFTLAAAGALAFASAATVPSVPDPHTMTISWTETVPSTKVVYNFAHNRAYDIKSQLYRDEELQNGKDLVQVTVERPSEDHKAYQADMQRSVCTNWTFTSLINGFVQTWPDMTLEKTETFDGTKCDKWTKVLGNETDPWSYSVWFDVKTGFPVGVFNTDDAKGGAVDKGIKHITKFTTTVPKGTFDIPALCQ